MALDDDLKEAVIASLSPQQADILRTALNMETSAEKLVRLECEITRLRTLLSEAEQQVQDARAKALEEAAKVAEQYVWDDHALIQATNIGKACHHQSREITTAIRALQSEER